MISRLCSTNPESFGRFWGGRVWSGTFPMDTPIHFWSTDSERTIRSVDRNLSITPPSNKRVLNPTMVLESAFETLQIHIVRQSLAWNTFSGIPVPSPRVRVGRNVSSRFPEEKNTVFHSGWKRHPLWIEIFDKYWGPKNSLIRPYPLSKTAKNPCFPDFSTAYNFSMEGRRRGRDHSSDSVFYALQDGGVNRILREGLHGPKKCMFLSLENLLALFQRSKDETHCIW